MPRRFRWVHFQLDSLARCLPGRIRLALDELPSTLDATYEHMLHEIEDTNWEFARRLLHFVAVVSRPLRVEELAELLAFDFNAGQIPEFREDWRLEDPVDAVLSTCSTLLSLVNVQDFRVVQFSHFSIKEFLTSTRFAEKRNTNSSRFHISLTPAHVLVAKACLGMLFHLNKDVTRGILPNFPLAEYAAEHWLEHAVLRVCHKVWRKEYQGCLIGGTHILQSGSGYATQQFLSGSETNVQIHRWRPMEPCYTTPGFAAYTTL